ncbi:MAG: hypothetical protein GY750_18195 [Lentisphaerae bacterium]|nr:hypothetical protein [Lentisphaerota bacterium]MCP4103328.1 hypothetical protein [Lentisphaerota bacterium]
MDVKFEELLKSLPVEEKVAQMMVHGSHFQFLAHRLAVEAGIDLLLLKDKNVLLYELHDALTQAVKSGRLPEERINQSLHRIWKLKGEWAFR